MDFKERAEEVYRSWVKNRSCYEDVTDITVALKEAYTDGLRRGAEIVASMKPSKYEKDKNKQCSHCEECCELIEKVILAEAEKEGKV